MPPLPAFVFNGIKNLLTDESQKLHQEDIDDDLEGEKETLAELTNDEITAERERTKRFSSRWRESVNEASKGVTERTDASYQRYFFFSFLYHRSTFKYANRNMQTWETVHYISHQESLN
jgi:hypothetical protein